MIGNWDFLALLWLDLLHAYGSRGIREIRHIEAFTFGARGELYADDRILPYTWTHIVSDFWMWVPDD